MDRGKVKSTEGLLPFFILFCFTERHEVATSVGNFHRNHNVAALDKNLVVLFFLPSMVICSDIPTSSLMSRMIM